MVRVRLGLLAVDLDARPRAGLGFCQAFPHVPVDRGAEGGFWIAVPKEAEMR